MLCSGLRPTAVFESFRSPGEFLSFRIGDVVRVTTTITLAAGTMFLLWLGERITEWGLENGVSLIIFTGIAVELPSEVIQNITLYKNGELGGFALFKIFLVIVVAFYIVAFKKGPLEESQCNMQRG